MKRNKAEAAVFVSNHSGNSFIKCYLYKPMGYIWYAHGQRPTGLAVFDRSQVSLNDKVVYSTYS